MNEELAASETAGASLAARHDHAERLEARGRFTVECVGEDGQVRWTEEFDNLVTTVGKNSLLDVGLGGSSFTAFKLGLVDGGSTPTFAAADTMASHAGWTESVAYSNASRPTPTFNAASAGSKSTTATAFTINATATVAGCFLTDTATKSGATGLLYSCGAFGAGNRSVLSGDTLNVTYAASV